MASKKTVKKSSQASRGVAGGASRKDRSPQSASPEAPARPKGRPGPAAPGRAARSAPRIVRGLELPDPRLAQSALRAVAAYKLALARVAANADQPALYPLPADSGSLEQTLRASYAALPARARKKAAKALEPLVKGTEADRRRELGDLAAIDLRSRVSVLDRMRELPVPAGLRLGQDELAAAEAKLRARCDLSAAPRGAGVARALTARVLRVECLKDTRELGKDEIFLSGAATDNVGNVRPFGPIDLGKFKTGEVVEFSAPERLEVFDFAVNLGGNVFPKVFFVSYTVTERDAGFFSKAGFGAAGLLVAALGFGGVLLSGGTALVFAAGIATVVAGMAAFNATIFSKDVSAPPETVFVALGSAADVFPDGRPDTPDETLDLALLGGRYRLTVDFLLK